MNNNGTMTLQGPLLSRKITTSENKTQRPALMLMLFVFLGLLISSNVFA